MQMRGVKRTPKEIFLDIFCDVVGGGLYAVALQTFSVPNSIAPGGVSGIAVLINHLVGFSVAGASLAINIPLLALAFAFLGHGFTLKTLQSVLIMTVELELAAVYLPIYQEDHMLAALCCGVLGGIGLALVFMRGSTTGGTDIVIRLIQRRLPYMQVGRLMLIIDICVLLASAVVFRSLSSALYGMVAIFTTTRILDSMLYGLDSGKMLMIISDATEDIVQKISEQLGRGSTLVRGRGAYTRQEKDIIYCAVRQSQLYELKQIVYSSDRRAFIIATDAVEILGEGFRENYHQHR
ncbi:YitT family protein [Oscillospiraceae bacterium MB08-C2-2]|nr:YitT family protein [Oscillospiraceae bacterium MB08-C2-2]